MRARDLRTFSPIPTDIFAHTYGHFRPYLRTFSPIPIIDKMKKILTLALLFVASLSVATAQKIISHTTTLAKVYDCHIDKIDYTAGNTVYEVWLNTEENKVSKSIHLDFDSKDKMTSVLQFLFNFNKGDGYYIDLESKNGACATSYGRGFTFSTPGTPDKVLMSQYIIGKLLNKLGISVNPGDDPSPKTNPNAKQGDDIYISGHSLF